MSNQFLNNRFKIQRSIGNGGMSEVFQAYDSIGDNKVAIKLFQFPKQDMLEIQREAHRRELESLQAIHHPYVVNLIDYGYDESKRPFLALELMNGDLVGEREKNPGHGIFTQWETFNKTVFTPLCNALEAIHNSPAAIAHRDIKPANLLVAEDGTIKLADFGIAKLKSNLTYHTTLQQYTSLPFSPPEPDNGIGTFSRDIYSLAMTTIWSLSPEPPKDQAHALSLLKGLNVPVPIRSMLQRAIALDRSERYESIAEVQIDLNAWAKGHQAAELAGTPPISIEFSGSVKRKFSQYLNGDDHEVLEIVKKDIEGPVKIERRDWKSEGLRKQLAFCIIGQTGLKYTVLKSQKDLRALTVTDVIMDFERQKDTVIRVPSPIRFVCAQGWGMKADEAESLLDQALASAEQSGDQEEGTPDIFDDWLALNDLLLRFDEQSNNPIPYRERQFEGGGLITIKVENGTSLEHVEVGQAWKFESPNGSSFACVEVYDVAEGQLTLHAIRPDYRRDCVPEHGILSYDNFANEQAAERKARAIKRIQDRKSKNQQIGDTIRCPERAMHEAGADTTLRPDTQELLDQWKQDAVRKILSSRDISLIEGPPGTGKTQLIAGLILETLHRNPNARILLASQTHVAIENALERTASKIPDARMLRIASGSKSSGTARFTLANQLFSWGAQVRKSAEAGFVSWCSAQGVNAEQLRASHRIRELAQLRQSSDDIREEMSQLSAEQPPVADASAFAVDHAEAIKTHQSNLGKINTRMADLKRRLDPVVSKKDLDRCGSAQDFETLASQVDGASAFSDRMKIIMEVQQQWLQQVGSSEHDQGMLIEACNVIGGTCVGIDRIQSDKPVDFDLCIIDEASKATAAEACIPIAMSNKIVLLGDSKQLPPFKDEALSSKEVQEYAYATSRDEASASLFDRMCQRLPENCRSMLRQQRRMVEPIGALVSDCFYEGKLVSVRKADDDTPQPVIWMSTHAIPGRHETPGISPINNLEVEKVLQVLRELDSGEMMCCGTKPIDVLVLSGYSRQVHLLRETTRRIQFHRLQVSCCTIDQVQGKEARVVIYSVTRSNKSASQGFLREARRVNVAMSRAMDQLIVIGDADFVEKLPVDAPMRAVLGWIKRHDYPVTTHVSFQPFPA